MSSPDWIVDKICEYADSVEGKSRHCSTEIANALWDCARGKRARTNVEGVDRSVRDIADQLRSIAGSLREKFQSEEKCS